MKKLISVFVVLAMILSLSATVFAVDKVTVYCKAPDSWSTCNVHWWNSSEGGSTWPGQPMTKGADGIWYAEIPADVGGLLFNKAGEEGKTSDLTLPNNGNRMYVIGEQDWAAYAAAETTVSSGTVNLNSLSDSEASLEIPVNPTSDGKVKVHMFASEPGWAFVFHFADGSTSLLITGNNDRVEEFDVVAGENYKVQIWCYDKAGWDFGDGDVTYAVTLNGGNGGGNVAMEEYVISNTKLFVGDNDLTMTPNAENTLFEFEPTETGVYTFTAPAGSLIGSWNSPNYPFDATTNKTNTYEWECTSVGQSVLIGVVGSEDIVLTVEKTSNADVQEQIVYNDYANVHSPSEDNMIILGEDTYNTVDVTQNVEVFKDENGFYHLGSVDGPLLYMNLGNEGFNIIQAFFGGYGANTMRGAYTDEDGNVFYYDFLSAMRQYARVIYNNVEADNSLYPLTDDLMIFMKAYGAYQGWFNPNQSPYEAINGEHNEDSAWLVTCCYFGDYEYSDPDAPADPDRPVDPENPADPEKPADPDVPNTGDIDMTSIIVLMALVAVTGAVLVLNKKRLF